MSIGNSFGRLMIRCVLRILVTGHGIVMKIVPGPRKAGGNPNGEEEKVTVLLTGTFYSENWIMNHLRPIAACKRCSKVYVVTTFPVPQTENVEIINPPPLLMKLLGKVPARLITFAITAVRRRPDYIGGFHLLLNGLLAALLARLTGAKSLYFCGGGPREVLDGGIHGSTLFGLMKRPDKYLEKKLIAAVDFFDIVITMGNRAAEYFKAHGVTTEFAVIPGGIPEMPQSLPDPEKEYDILFVGRLEQVKRVDILLDAVRLVSDEKPEVRAAIVGAGSLEKQLKLQAEQLAIMNNVLFTGYQRDVRSWLARSKLFLITSDSEGLPLALMEAMMAGLPCVVSDVGEMGEIVIDGENGYLIAERSAEAFAERIIRLLSDNEHYQSLKAAVNRTARQFMVDNASAAWDRIL